MEKKIIKVKVRLLRLRDKINKEIEKIVFKDLK
jgi:hypothetical protein